MALPPLAWEPVPKPEAMQAKQSADCGGNERNYHLN
jgi:hypothetical protein